MCMKLFSDYHGILAIAFALLVACISCSSRTHGPNSGPVAISDADRSVTTGQSIVLDGSLSYDPDGDQLSYEWSIVFSPAGSRRSLQGETQDRSTLLIDAPGAWLVQLIVSDGTNTSAPALIQIKAESASNGVPPQGQGTGSQGQNTTDPGTGGISPPSTTPVASATRWLYWTANNGISIERLSLDGSNIRQTIVNEDGAISHGLVVDTSLAKLYWGTVKDGVYIFYAANLDGSGQTELFRVPENDEIDPDNSPILDLAYDSVTKTLYWTLQGVGAIYHWSALNPTVGSFNIAGKIAPRGLAMDPQSQRLFFSDSTNGGIYQFTIANQALVQVVNDVPGPADIELDTTTGDIVWTDIVLDKIQSASQSDLLHPRDIINWIPGANQPIGLALDQSDKMIYWCDYKQNKIWKTAMNGTSTQEVIAVQSPFDALIVHIP